MLRKYFISLYFQILKKRLHKMRLHFFFFFNEFQILVRSESFWSNVCGFIEDSMVSFSSIMNLINRIEWIEKYMEKWDIFDSNFYALQIHMDILKVISPIENELSMKLTELKSVKNNTIEINNAALTENMSLQYHRISSLINDMENNIERLRNIIEQLNNNILRYTSHRTI